MKKLFIGITLAVISFEASSRETMVYMREDGTSKHIVEASDQGTTVLTTGSLWHLYPDISSDARSITYVAGKSELELAVYLLQTETKKQEKWTADLGMTLHPRFAQNSNLLFFAKPVAGGNKLSMINLKEERNSLIPQSIQTENGIVWDYSKAKVETFAIEGSHYFPAPKQDGTMVYFQKNTNGKKEIASLIIKENKVEILDEGMAPSLAKGEDKLVYTKKVNGNWDIYVQNLMTKTITRVTTHEASDFAPSFDRNDNIIFASNRNDENEFSLFIAKPSGDTYAVSELVSEKGASFYAPRISGVKEITQSLRQSIPGEPRSSFGAIYHQDKIFIAGGHQGAEHTYPPESFTGRVQYYDFKDNKWHEASPRIYKCHGFQLASFGKYIYAFGGFAYDANNNPKWKSLDVVERYDTEKDQWTVISKMPRRRSSNAVVTVGDKAYILGGWDSTPKFNNDLDGTFHSEIDVFDFKTNSFETLSVLLPKKRRAFTAVEKEGKILMIGGISEGASHFNLLSDVTSFDPATLEFKELTKLPFATFAPAAGVLNNQLYVFGGMFKMGEWMYDYVPHVYRYSFKEKSWEHTGRYLSESKGFSQVVPFKDSLGVLGGHTYQYEQDRPVGTFEVFK